MTALRQTPGYSGKPMISKLGIKAGIQVLTINAPADYAEWLGPLPEKTVIITRAPGTPLEFIHLFSASLKSFPALFAGAKKKLSKTGMLWVSWPKKTSGVETDLTENNIRDVGLASGLVDVKVCAVSEVWSGLKFVHRLKDR